MTDSLAPGNSISWSLPVAQQSQRVQPQNTTDLQRHHRREAESQNGSLNRTQQLDRRSMRIIM